MTISTVSSTTSVRALSGHRGVNVLGGEKLGSDMKCRPSSELVVERAKRVSRTDVRDVEIERRGRGAIDSGGSGPPRRVLLEISGHTPGNETSARSAEKDFGLASVSDARVVPCVEFTRPDRVGLM